MLLDFELQGVYNHPPVETKRSLRSGAEEEYSTRGELGMNLPKSPAFHLALPETFQKPFNKRSYELITPHESLRVFKEYARLSEVDPEFHLRYSTFQFSDSLDPDGTKDMKLLKRQYLSSTPGMDGIKNILHKDIE